MGALGAAAGVVGAAFVGWELGRALDEALGISDAIADIQEAEILKKQKIAGAVLEGRPEGFLGMEAARRGVGVDRMKEAKARRVLTIAESEGFIREGGQIFAPKEVQESIKAARAILAGAERRQQLDLQVTVDDRRVTVTETEDSKTRRSTQ
jgi:hypothetical protein